MAVAFNNFKIHCFVSSSDFVQVLSQAGARIIGKYWVDENKEKASRNFPFGEVC